MRLRHKVIVKIADDTEMKDKLFETDETLAESVSDGFTTSNSGKLKIAASATETIDFGDVTVVKGFFLKVDKECIVTINGGDEFQMRIPPTGKWAKLFLEGDITAVTVEAPASAVDGVYAIWGDVEA